MTDRIDTPTCNCFPGDGQPHLMACPEYWREAEKVWADLEAEVQRLRGERDELQERIAAVSQGLADGAPVELLLRFTASAFDWNLEETQRAAKMLLKRFYPEATEAVERHRASLASLRASHQEVVKAAYREGWNECIRSGPTDQSRGDSVDKCWESSDAKDAADHLTRKEVL